PPTTPHHTRSLHDALPISRAGHLERPVALARPRPGRAERGRAALVREGRRDGDRPPHRVAPVPHPSGQGGEGGADLPGRVVLDRPAHLGRRHPGLPSVLRQPAAQAELHATTLRGVARRSRRWFCWPMAELVLSSLDRGVLTLTFNRPDRLNAWTEELGRRYFDLLAEAEKDPQVRAIVVTGAGRGFCAGADFEALAAIQQGTYASEPDPRPNTFPTTIAKPVIAAVNGACAGLGMVHALMCDLVFTAEDAKWTTAFARRGLVAEYGLGWVLPRVMGQQRAMDVLLSGRTFSGREACELGLALRAVPGDRVLEEARAYARDLAAYSSPASMSVIKRPVWGDWTTTLDQSYQRAVEEMAASFGRPDFAEGIASFVERRDPDFPPL